MGEHHSLELPVLFLLFPSGIVYTIVYDFTSSHYVIKGEAAGSGGGFFRVSR